jgi:hypothetical protein
MTISIRRTILLVAAPVALAAQGTTAPQGAPSAAPSAAKPVLTDYAISGSAGGAQRAESGKQENGSRLQASYALVRAPDKVGTISVRELSIGFAQMNTTAGTYAVRENSIEFGAIADVVAYKDGVWHVDAGAGVVLARSIGCMTNGSDTKAAGTAPCVHSYAEEGTTRIGYRARVTSNWSGPITTAFVGLELSGNTISSGKTVAPGFFLGLRYSIGTFGQ